MKGMTEEIFRVVIITGYRSGHDFKTWRSRGRRKNGLNNSKEITQKVQ